MPVYLISFAEVRESSQVPLVLFQLLQSILQMGLENCSALRMQALDGVPRHRPHAQESEDYRRILAAHISIRFPRAPTSTDERLAKIAACSSGFLYLISRTGVTGAKDALPDDLPPLLRRPRSVHALPFSRGLRLSCRWSWFPFQGLADAAGCGLRARSETEKAIGYAAAARLRNAFAYSGS